MARRAVARVAVAAVLLVGVGACARDQDPGIEPTGSSVEGPTSPPRFPEACPPGGPDATTPAAGCVDPDGNILRP